MKVSRTITIELSERDAEILQKMAGNLKRDSNGNATISGGDLAYVHPGNMPAPCTVSEVLEFATKLWSAITVMRRGY